MRTVVRLSATSHRRPQGCTVQLCEDNPQPLSEDGNDTQPCVDGSEVLRPQLWLLEKASKAKRSCVSNAEAL